MPDDTHPKAEWETMPMWRQHIERRLYELGCLVKGQIPVQADRIADVLEQIADLRIRLDTIQERVDKMSAWAKSHDKKNG